MILNVSCKSNKSEDLSLISEKEIDLQMIDSYKEGLALLEKGDGLSASNKFNESEILYPQSIWASRSSLMSAYSLYTQMYYIDAVDELEHRLSDAVKLQSLADVPLGAFLSGGVDSSTIVALMQQQARYPVKTFTVGFEESGFDEAPYARAVAKHLGTDHTEMFVTAAEAQEVIAQLPSMYDEPFADPSQIPTFLLSKYTRKRVKVAISGEGADELFGGYPRYNKISDYWKKTKDIPLFLKKFFHHISLKSSPSSTKFIYSIGKKMRKLSHLSLDELYKDEMSKWRPDEFIYNKTDLDFIENGNFKNDIVDFRQLMLKDMNSYLPGNLLVKVDRASMTNSLEVRSPFLDENLIKFVWSLPDEYIKIKNSKAILKDILEGDLNKINKALKKKTLAKSKLKISRAEIAIAKNKEKRKLLEYDRDFKRH